MTALYTLIFSLILSWEDWRHQSFPLWLWVIFTLPLLFLIPLTPTFWTCLLLAILLTIFPVGMGAGDLLYLATTSLTLTFQELLWLIQIASLLGIAYFFLKKKAGQPIPFVPFLTVGYLIVSIIKHLLG